MARPPDSRSPRSTTIAPLSSRQSTTDAVDQAEWKAKLDAGRVDTVFKVGDRVLLRTKELLNTADIGKLRPRWDGPFTVMATEGLPEPQRLHARVAVQDALQPCSQCRPAQALFRPGRPAAPARLSI